MGETIEKMEKENELRNDKTNFLAFKLGILNEEIMEHLEKVNLSETFSY